MPRAGRVDDGRAADLVVLGGTVGTLGAGNRRAGGLAACDGRIGWHRRVTLTDIAQTSCILLRLDAQADAPA